MYYVATRISSYEQAELIMGSLREVVGVRNVEYHEERGSISFEYDGKRDFRTALREDSSTNLSGLDIILGRMPSHATV